MVVRNSNDVRPLPPNAAPTTVGGSRRATRAFVDLDRFAANVHWFRHHIGLDRELMAVVKANAYGHGAEVTAQTALAAGASHLAVATIDEGVQLRGAGLVAPTLVLGPTFAEEFEAALGHDLALAIADPGLVPALASAARRSTSPRPASVHVKVDTGMRRFGATPNVAIAIAQDIAMRPELSLDGFFTHFASADEEDEAFTDEQAALLVSCLDRLKALGIRPARVHAANSAGTLRFERHHYDLVRVGISLYGLRPAPEVVLPDAVQPVMSLRSRVARVVELEPGETVSYGRTYRASEPERAALVPIGYADGYSRVLSNRSWMGLAGQRAPVRGRVCMDQTMVGVPTDAVVKVGDEVTVAGDGSHGEPSFDQLADLAGTISYEMVTSLPPRVPRHYVADGNTVAISELRGVRRVDDNDTA